MKRIDQLIQQAKECEKELPPEPAAQKLPVGKEVARNINPTLLKMDATSAQLRQHCPEASQYKFASVCVNPVNVARCAANRSGASAGINIFEGALQAS